MDRIDLLVDVPRPDPTRLLGAETSSACSAELRSLVMLAREFARERPMRALTDLMGVQLLAACSLTRDGTRFLEHAARVHHLSGRALTRVLRVSRTIADLEQSSGVHVEHLSEALGYRTRGAA